MLVGTNIQGLNNGAIESKFNFEVGCCDLWAMKEIQSWYDCKPIIFLIPLSYPPKYQYFIKKKKKKKTLEFLLYKANMVDLIHAPFI